MIAHLPGAAWVPGVPFREQPGVELHLGTMRGWLDSGRLVMGGPFLDEAGGGMAIVAFASLEDAEAAAHADPAVRAGLLEVQVRPWLMGMSAAQR